MVKRARRWVVVAACGQWMVAGDRSQAAGGRRGCCLCPSVGAGRHLWAVVAGCGRLWLGGRFWAVVVVFVNKSKRERRGLPELMSTVTTTHVVTVWTTCTSIDVPGRIPTVKLACVRVDVSGRCRW